MKSPSLLREVMREYVRSQRRSADCGDTASTVECHILTELLRAEQITQQELASRLMLDKAWISRGIDRLVDAGLVARTPHPTDKRRVRLQLSDDGRARAEALDSRLESHAASLLDRLSPDQDIQLAGLLTQVLANLRSDPPACRAACKAPQPGYRHAETADWPSIESLLRAASLPTVDAVEHLDRFTVGVEGNDLVAAGAFECYGAKALLRSFVVADSARGRGVGSSLLQRVLSDAAGAGVQDVYLLTRTAAPFFASHGFRAIERREAPDAICNTREFAQLCPASAQLMVRSLSNFDRSPCRPPESAPLP
jgi:amino-acid N-acetyltransferase